MDEIKELTVSVNQSTLEHKSLETSESVNAHLHLLPRLSVAGWRVFLNLFVVDLWVGVRMIIG